MHKKGFKLSVAPQRNHEVNSTILKLYQEISKLPLHICQLLIIHSLKRAWLQSPCHHLSKILISYLQLRRFSICDAPVASVFVAFLNEKRPAFIYHQFVALEAGKYRSLDIFLKLGTLIRILILLFYILSLRYLFTAQGQLFTWLLLVIGAFRGTDHRVQLTHHNGTLSYGSKFPPSELVDKVTEGIVVFLFSFGLLNGQLQLTLDFSHEEIVDHDVVGRVIQLVFDPDQLELPLHRLTLIEKVERFKQSDETALGAL